MPTTAPIWPSQTQVKLNGSGAGTAYLGPTGHGVVWTLGNISVKTVQTVSTGTCQCSLYVGDDASATNFVDSTFSGDTGDTSDAAAGMEVRLGKKVWAVWSGGVASDVATLTITGSMRIP